MNIFCIFYKPTILSNNALIILFLYLSIFNFRFLHFIKYLLLNDYFVSNLLVTKLYLNTSVAKQINIKMIYIYIHAYL